MFLISPGAPRGKFHDEKSLETYMLLYLLQERVSQRSSTNTMVGNFYAVGADLCVRDG